MRTLFIYADFDWLSEPTLRAFNSLLVFVEYHVY